MSNRTTQQILQKLLDRSRGNLLSAQTSLDVVRKEMKDHVPQDHSDGWSLRYYSSMEELIRTENCMYTNVTEANEEVEVLEDLLLDL